MCRNIYDAGKLGPRLRRALEALPGWSWQHGEEPWLDWVRKGVVTDERLRALGEYVRAHGWYRFRRTRRGGIEHGGADLAECLNRWRALHKQGRVPKWLCRRLEAIPGFQWEQAASAQAACVALLDRLDERHAGETSRRVPDELASLALFIDHVRELHRTGRLDRRSARALGVIPGWRWR